MENTESKPRIKVPGARLTSTAEQDVTSAQFSVLREYDRETSLWSARPVMLDFTPGNG